MYKTKWLIVVWLQIERNYNLQNTATFTNHLCSCSLVLTVLHFQSYSGTLLIMCDVWYCTKLCCIQYIFYHFQYLAQCGCSCWMIENQIQNSVFTRSCIFSITNIPFKYFFFNETKLLKMARPTRAIIKSEQYILRGPYSVITYYFYLSITHVSLQSTDKNLELFYL